MPKVAVTIEVDSIVIEREQESLHINNAIERRSTAFFRVMDRTNTLSFQRGQEVEITIPGHTLFKGLVFVPTRRFQPHSTDVIHTLECVDWHYLADKRRVAESYVSQTAKFIVEDIWTKYLSPEGIIIGEVQTGPTIEEMVINYQPASVTLDALAEKAGFIWYIDSSKALYFVERPTTPAPFIVDEGDVVRPTEGSSAALENRSEQYRNRQYLRAGRDVTILQTETYTGDGVNLSFTVGYPINQVPTVTVNAVAQTVGIKGLSVAKDCYWSKGDPVVVFTVAPGAVPVVIAYYGEYDIMVMVDDVAEIIARQAVEGGTGLVEMLDDESALNQRQAAFDSASAKLERYGIIGKQFNFGVWDWGLAPGQLVTVDYAEYGLSSEELLIESVDIREAAPGYLLYTVKAISGPEMGDWTAFFKKLAQAKDEILGRLNVGSNQVLIILAETEGNWEWTGAVTETVFT